MKPKVKKIWDAFTTVLVILVVILTMLLVGARLVGLRVFSILSPSMEPAYHVGSLIYVKKTAPAAVRVGDPITFVLNEDLVVATHRVVRIEETTGGSGRSFLYYTKGDANETEDGSPVHSDNLLGVPIFTIPRLGVVAHFVQHPPGLYIAVGAGVVVLLLVFLPDILKKKPVPAPPQQPLPPPAQPPAQP